MSIRAFIGLGNYVLVSVRVQYDQQVYPIAILLRRLSDLISDCSVFVNGLT